MLLCQLGRYSVSWDATLSAGTLLCQLGRYSVSWDTTLSAGTLLCQLGRYSVSWDATSVSWDTTLSAGTLLCQLGHYSVSWDATLSAGTLLLSAGTLLCQLRHYSVGWDTTLHLGRYSVNWDTTLSDETLLCRLGRYSVGWDATLSACGILFNGQFSTVSAMYITFISRFTIIKHFNTIFRNRSQKFFYQNFFLFVTVILYYSASPLRPVHMIRLIVYYKSCTICICPSQDGPYYVIVYGGQAAGRRRAGGRTSTQPHNNFSSVYRIFTKLGHMISTWKGKNSIYCGVIRSKVKFDNLYRQAYFVMHTFLVVVYDTTVHT